jgi:hypothetical protein
MVMQQELEHKRDLKIKKKKTALKNYFCVPSHLQTLDGHYTKCTTLLVWDIDTEKKNVAASERFFSKSYLYFP